MPYYVYILRSPRGQLYIGQTEHLLSRLGGHKTKKGAKFPRDYGAHQLVHIEEYETRLEAMRRERQIKGWTRAKKEALIVGKLELLERL